MKDRSAPSPRSSSRTLAVVAVAALVLIAIAGIVLASLGNPSPDTTSTAATDATQAASAAMTAASQAAALAEKEAGPNYVVFTPGSTELSQAATAKIVRIAAEARKRKPGIVVIGTRVEIGPANLELARKRASAIRSVLEANEVPAKNVQTKVEQAPPGIVGPAESNRVGLTVS